MTPKSRVKRVRVNVTAEDIEKGVSCSTWSCPLALAVERTIGKPVEVGELMWLPRGAEISAWIPLPRSAVRFIHRFDRGRRGTEPFSFYLTVTK